MSLELALEKNTAAISALTPVLAALIAALATTAVSGGAAAATALVATGATAEDTKTAKADKSKADKKTKKDEEKTAATTKPEAGPDSSDDLTGNGSDDLTGGDDDLLGGEDEKPATLDDVREAIKNLATAKGRDEAIRILKNYGAKNAGDLKSEDFSRFVKAANIAAKAE